MAGLRIVFEVPKKKVTGESKNYIRKTEDGNAFIFVYYSGGSMRVKLSSVAAKELHNPILPKNLIADLCRQAINHKIDLQKTQ